MIVVTLLKTFFSSNEIEIDFGIFCEIFFF